MPALRSALISMIVLGPVLVGGPAGAEDTAAAGPIVVEHCAPCHAVPQVNPAGQAPMPGAPAFQDIADDPVSYNRERIAQFLARPHFPMKGLTLSPGDIDNLLAYFDSLRGRPR